MRVCIVPYSEGNPYQRLLVQELRAAGATVTLRTGRQWLKGLVRQTIRREDPPDIIHLHWLPSFEVRFRAYNFWPSSYFGLLLRLWPLRRLGRRIVWTVHNLYNHEAPCRWADRILIKSMLTKASRVIVHSPTAVQLVSEEFGQRGNEKFVVVPHGNYIGCYSNTVTQQEARTELKLEPRATALLFFGNIRAYKGVTQLIRAYRDLNEPLTTLVIAGKPQERGDQVAVQEAVAGTANVQLHAGLVPDDRVQVFFNACEIAVFPYLNILSSGAVILAMSFGRACVAPRLGCIPDLLDDRGAFLYNPEDPDGLREALRAALRNRERLAAMGAYNLERARTWPWERVARETIDAYRAALAG
jgi:glycosyltransferase involved in cell wall biosynthesis